MGTRREKESVRKRVSSHANEREQSGIGTARSREVREGGVDESRSVERKRKNTGKRRSTHANKS
jgi:hypothetical protein